QPVSRDEIILPERIIEELERTIIRFCGNRERLRALGLPTKRGVLFYGPPGTGKTHTVRYLASQLQGHTTFLVTAEQIGLLPEYFSLARLMQPVIFVIEDADLLAKARESMHSPVEEALLNHLLNEMDGLKEDADILFVLSTNKPEALEAALVARPGRIDQLIEFPKPDENCRLRLMKLYGAALTLTPALEGNIANRTQGVSASFIKELMRRLAQYSIERGEDGHINEADVEQALEEMLFTNNLLNRAILGADGVDAA
ncbi:MAG: ATP-binding protein, partial [Methylovulum sp.]|nr:ATP-binding protein [Methylovulum sp.]